MSDNISREDAINVVVEYDVEQLPDKDGIHQAKAIITKATLCQEENAHSGEVTEMVDLISRQDAIEAVCGDCTIERKDKCKTDGYCYEVKNLMALPSAEAVQGFRGGKIPPNEMLNGTVLIPKHQWIEMERELAELKSKFESADAVHGYTEWLEKIIVEAETFEWLCEEATDEEWCEKNCNYASIQAECLRHLYEVSKGGVEEEPNTLPSVERQKGEWKWTHGGQCSECGFHNTNFDFNFCPNCGADMRGEDDG